MTKVKKMMLRNAFGERLVELGDDMPNIVVLDADISSSLKTTAFAERFPERHINCGAAEQNMMMTAAGLATTGLVPLACTYATFSSMRACEQIRSFICYPELNVKVISTHGGIEVGWDGPTHQATEDIAIMRAFPNMTIVVPADANSTRALLPSIIKHKGPCYLRMNRNPVPIIYEDSEDFELGKAKLLRGGDDVTLVAVGIMVSVALEAADQLLQEDIRARVIDMHTIKPIDKEVLLAAGRETGAIVTLEDHSVNGGLGGAVAEVVAENQPVPVIRIGVRDTFAESGDPLALFSKYGMSSKHVIEAVRQAITARNMHFEV